MILLSLPAAHGMGQQHTLAEKRDGLEVVGNENHQICSIGLGIHVLREPRRPAFPLGQPGRVPKQHVPEVVEIAERLGYPDLSTRMRGSL